MATEIFTNPITLLLDKRSGTLNVPIGSWTTVGEINATQAAGTYEFWISLTLTQSNNNDTALVQFSGNGGSTWNTFNWKSNSANQTEAAVYGYPLIHAGGTFHGMLQVQADTGTTQLDVDFSDIWLKRIN